MATNNTSVKVTLNLSDPTVKRYMKEKGAEAGDAAQYFADFGVSRKASLYSDRDKRGEGKPAKPKAAKTKAPKAEKAPKAAKKVAKKVAKKATKRTVKAKAAKSAKGSEDGKSSGAALSADTISAIKALKEEGFSNKDISEQLEITGAAVYQAFKG